MWKLLASQTIETKQFDTIITSFIRGVRLSLGHMLAPVAILVLSGCGTVFDPAPYKPVFDKNVLQSNIPPYTRQSILQFDSFADASIKLEALSDGYGDTADSFSRQQLIFDIPMFGLAVAAVANGNFKGSKDATVALGLSSATVAGGRAYFAPQTKVGAYSNASYSLDCGSSVATLMAKIQNTNQVAMQTTYDTLNKLVASADETLINGNFGGGAALTKDQTTNLLAARDQALKAFQDLSAARDTLTNGPAQLESFARLIIKSTSKSIVTGTQNIDAAIALVKGATTPAPTPSPAPKALPGAVISSQASSFADLGSGPINLLAKIANG